MKSAKLVNVKNDFISERFEALCEELEKGEVVRIYVDCIGHTRKEWVEADYAKALRQKYGDRLQVDESDRWSTHYYLA